MIVIVVVVVVVFKCLMSCPIYRGGLTSSRDSREFYHVPRILDIYMCWNSMENSRVFTSSCARVAQNVPELGQASTLGLVLALQPEIMGNWASELGGP